MDIWVGEYEVVDCLIYWYRSSDKWVTVLFLNLVIHYANQKVSDSPFWKAMRNKFDFSNTIVRQKKWFDVVTMSKKYFKHNKFISIRCKIYSKFWKILISLCDWLFDEVFSQFLSLALFFAKVLIIKFDCLSKFQPILNIRSFANV